MPARFTFDTDPKRLFDDIEGQFDSPSDPYRQQIEKLMAATLRDGDADTIRTTEIGTALERAARETGFVLGFEYCRQLLTRQLGDSTRARRGSKR